MSKSLAIVFLLSLSSCGIFSGVDPEKRTAFQIANVEKVLIDSLTVEHQPSTFRLIIDGELSDSAKIVWSYSVDSLSSPNPSIYRSAVLKKGKVKYEFRGDFYNKMVYFRYVPFNSGTRGNLKVQLMLL